MPPVRHVRRTQGPATTSSTRRRRLFRGTADRERGAAIIEGAIVAPVFFLLILGLFDGAWALFGDHVIQGGASAGVRTASALANDADADYNALQAVKKNLSGLGKAKLIRVVVYKANGFGDPPTTGCRGGTPSTGICNVYDGTDLEAGATAFGCVNSSSLDWSWCPATRKTAVQGANSPPDYVGVWILARHVPLTGIVTSAARDITTQSVLRIEPRAR
ncbi:MAG TPA: TadE/TadG family type IV pilus assembly protein [Iamia sp.]